MSRQVHYWEKQKKHTNGDRLAWYAAKADETFWHDYWQESVTEQYYQTAAETRLKSSKLGQILLANLNPEGLHLEAGCGAGFWVAALHYQGFKVIGIEYAQELVEKVRSVAPSLPIEYGDALDLEYPDDHFDSYISFGVVEHRQAGPEPFLAEAHRVMRPDGRLIISVPNFGWLRHKKSFLFNSTLKPDDEFFQYGFGADEFSSIITAAGFTVEKTTYLHLHRLLIEEIQLYRWFYGKRGGHKLKTALEQRLHDKDGHMLLIVAKKKEVS